MTGKACFSTSQQQRLVWCETNKDCLMESVKGLVERYAKQVLNA